MKTIISSIVLLAVALIVGGCETTDPSSSSTALSSPASADGRVTVNFENPANFTDLKSSSMDGFDESYLNELKTYVDHTAREYLADGEKVEFTFTDFDMAGEYEPWRMNASNVRMVKSIYLPRAKFKWVVTDASGKTLREGNENISDMNYRTNIGNITQDELFYEKEMLRNWMRSNLRAK